MKLAKNGGRLLIGFGRRPQFFENFVKQFRHLAGLYA